ncbi:hypothetical protein HYW21_05555 [Candidatus Woesearchaeota archaeon]|nr:hypothetical protein [Candidatus Woesearchaeota archaeon]
MAQEKYFRNMNAELLIGALKSKDKKVRYKVLDNIMKLSRSNKTTHKQEFLNLVLLKSDSNDWEERYVAMYAVSRFYRKNWDFKDFRKQFLNALRLIDDNDGRVRIAARNALEHFRTNFLLFTWGEWDTDEKEIVDLWSDSLFSLWEKIRSLEEGKMQLHFIECIKILYQHDMDAYLNKQDYKKYQQIWEKVNELDNLYYEYGQ